MSGLELNTPRLRLRAPTLADAAWLQSLYSRPDVARYLPTGPWTPEISDAEVLKRLSRTGLDDPARALSLLATFDGHTVADIEFWLTDREHRIAAIGWVGDPEFSRLGMVTESAAAVLEYAFTYGHVRRVAATIDPRNTASVAVAERLGMHREGHLREAEWQHGEWCDTLIYAILAADPRPWRA